MGGRYTKNERSTTNCRRKGKVGRIEEKAKIKTRSKFLILKKIMKNVVSDVYLACNRFKEIYKIFIN